MNADELEAQLRANPDDVEAHLVYADLLQSRGDPQGELVMIQHGLATKRTKALERQEAAWFAAFPIPSTCTVTWRLGFARAVEVDAKSQIVGLRALLKQPAFRFLEKLTVSGTESLVVRLATEAQPYLRELELRCASELKTKALTKLVAARPELRRLRLIAPHLDAEIAIASPKLEELELYRSGEDELDVNADTPALCSLVIDTDVVSEATLAAICDRRWPLRRLGLFVDDGVEPQARLERSKVWAMLEEVGLWWNDSTLAASLSTFGTRRALVSAGWGPTMLYTTGQGLRDLGRFADAMRCFELGVIAGPDDPDMWLEHGNLLQEVDRTPESLASYQRATRLDPKHYASHYMIAQYYRDVGPPELGFTAVKKACKLGSGDPAVWHIRGQLEARLGKSPTASFTKARQLYQQFIGADPNDSDPQFQLACVHELMGDRAACLKQLAVAILLDPAVKALAAKDIDLTALRDDPAFVKLVSA